MQVSKLLAKLETQVHTLTNEEGTSVASVTGTATDSPGLYGLTFSDVGGTKYVRMTDPTGGPDVQEVATPSGTSTTLIAGLTVTYAGTIVAGDYATVLVEDTVDIIGDLYGALAGPRGYNASYVDTFSRGSGSEDLDVVDGDSDAFLSSEVYIKITSGTGTLAYKDTNNAKITQTAIAVASGDVLNFQIAVEKVTAAWVSGTFAGLIVAVGNN